MKITIKERAKDKMLSILENKRDIFFKISLVRYDCNGPVLSMVTSSNPNSEKAIEMSGFKFIMREEEEKMFNEVEIDYLAKGLREGFEIKPTNTLFKSCYFN